MDLTDLQNQRVGVLGFGQEGQAVASFLLRHGIKPVLFDKSEIPQAADQGLATFTGADYLEHLNQVDLVFRSPGIWRLTPEIIAAEHKGLIVTSQVRWFFDHSPAPIIGVTGTKGKGTTASLIYRMLQAQGFRTYLTGNVGLDQPLDFLTDLKPSDWVVYELSSFQLQDLHRSPHIGVVLMTTEDHLDVHASLPEYQQAKSAITKFQTTADFAIINDDYPVSKELGQLGNGEKILFSRQHQVDIGSWVAETKLMIKLPQGEYQFDLSQVPLRGQHNWENISAAILASLIAGATEEPIKQGLAHFQPLRHRLQALPEQSGVKFYNDSFSTVPGTAIAGIRSYTEPLILIIGGSDKGADPDPLIEEIIKSPQIKAVAAIGATGPLLAEKLQAAGFNKILLQGFGDLKQTMQSIKKIAQPGDVVLLSPAYASFDWYENYKKRGEDFAALAAQWATL